MHDEGRHPSSQTLGGAGLKDQAFYDDSSSALGIGHSAYGVRGLRQDEENAEYRKAILACGSVDWLVAHLKQNPETRHLQPSDMEQLAIDRYLSIRGGAHDRARNYVQGGMELQAAIMKAESDLTQSEDTEAAEESLEPDDVTPDPQGEWPSSKVEALMKAPVNPKGGGSKSKSYKSRSVPDAPVVEQALRKDMVA